MRVSFEGSQVSQILLTRFDYSHTDRMAEVKLKGCEIATFCLCDHGHTCYVDHIKETCLEKQHH